MSCLGNSFSLRANVNIAYFIFVVLEVNFMTYIHR